VQLRRCRSGHTPSLLLPPSLYCPNPSCSISPLAPARRCASHCCATPSQILCVLLALVLLLMESSYEASILPKSEPNFPK
jgi:hypothetical protein